MSPILVEEGVQGVHAVAMSIFYIKPGRIRNDVG